MSGTEQTGTGLGAVGRAAASLVESIRADAAAGRPISMVDGVVIGGADRPRDAGEAAGRARLVGEGNRPSTGGFGVTDLRAVGSFVELVRRLVFPGYFDPGAIDAGHLEEHVVGLAAQAAEVLRREVESVVRFARRDAAHGHRVTTAAAVGGMGAIAGLAEATGRPRLRIEPGASDSATAGVVVDALMERLRRVREMVALDVAAAYAGDPAAEHWEECILSYPGVDAMLAHRVAHELYALGVPVIPRVIAEQAHGRTGIDIHPGARVGERFFIDHGSGVVIGETTVIGRDVKVYQGVTLGARSLQQDEQGNAVKGTKRHPTIGDRVTIYAGAVILGGDTVIGDDCVIAGGVFLTNSVPAGHVVMQRRAELKVRKAGEGRGGSVMWGDGI